MDIAASILQTCDSLGFQRGTGSARLCTMRGIDRYVDSRSLPLAESYHSAPCCTSALPPNAPYAAPQVYYTPGAYNYYIH